MPDFYGWWTRGLCLLSGCGLLLGTVELAAGREPQFSAPITLGVDLPNTYNLVMGDLNGDGLQDVILPNYFSPSFYWFERKPTVEPAYISHVIDTPDPYGEEISMGDLDHDGDLDLVASAIDQEGRGKRLLVWRENDGARQPSFTTHIIDSESGLYQNLVTDLDHDGDLDIVAISVTSGSIFWFENDGVRSPGFIRHDVVRNVDKYGQFPIVAADLDGDGDQDLLTATGQDRQMTWYENSGGPNPTFTAHLFDQTGQGTLGVADLDRDGDLDIYGSNDNPDYSLVWFENDGAQPPTFTRHTIAHRPDFLGGRSMAVDLDRDGDLDFLVLAGMNGNTDGFQNQEFQFYENNGASPPVFTERFVQDGLRVRNFLVADQDGDGDPDLLRLDGALISGIKGTPNLFWQENLAQQPALGVTPRADFQPEGYTPGPFAPDTMRYAIQSHATTQTLSWTATVTQSWLDLDRTEGLLSPDEATTITVRLNARTATLTPGEHTAEIAFRDARMQALVATHAVKLTIKPAILGRFATQHEVGGLFDSYNHFAQGDFNGDGRPDFAVTGYYAQSILQFDQTADPKAPYFLHEYSHIANYTSAIASGDLDGDGDMDLLTDGYDSGRYDVIWHENTGGDQQSFIPHVIVSDNLNTRGLLMADLDGDKDLDVVASAGDSLIRWFENDGASPPKFTAHEVSRDAKIDQTCALLARDLDGDGDLDLISATDKDNKVAWYENDGHGAFTTHLIDQRPYTLHNPRYFWSLACADLDGDGDLDVIASDVAWYPDTGRIYWYENDGGKPARFTAHLLNDTMTSALSLVAVDLDRDGDLDLFGIDQNEREIVFLENDGAADPTFTPHLFSKNAWTAAILPLDMDGDHDLDLAVLGWDSAKLVWLENTSEQAIIHLITQNDGRALTGDSLVTVSWSTDINRAGSGVRFELWRDQQRLFTLGEDYNLSGSHTTEVYLPLVPESADYRLRVVSTFDPSLYDESDRPFAITGGPVKLAEPNGGQTWITGALEWAHWQVNPLFAGTAVELQLYKGNRRAAVLGQGWDPDGESLSYFTVPNVPSGNDYKVRVVSRWNPAYYDESNQTFTIVNPGGDGELGSAVSGGAWACYQ